MNQRKKIINYFSKAGSNIFLEAPNLCKGISLWSLKGLFVRMVAAESHGGKAVVARQPLLVIVAASSTSTQISLWALFKLVRFFPLIKILVPIEYAKLQPCNGVPSLDLSLSSQDGLW